MPKRVLIIGILFCLFGALAIWEALEDLLRSRINLNFGVFILPVGIGLLRGKPSSQWWARFWIILGYVGCGLILAIGTLAPGTAQATVYRYSVRGAAALPLLFAMTAILAGTLYAVHRLLYSRRANEFFHRVD